MKRGVFSAGNARTGVEAFVHAAQYGGLWLLEVSFVDGCGEEFEFHFATFTTFEVAADAACMCAVAEVRS